MHVCADSNARVYGMSRWRRKGKGVNGCGLEGRRRWSASTRVLGPTQRTFKSTMQFSLKWNHCPMELAQHRHCLYSPNNLHQSESQGVVGMPHVYPLYRTITSRILFFIMPFSIDVTTRVVVQKRPSSSLCPYSRQGPSAN